MTQIPVETDHSSHGSAAPQGKTRIIKVWDLPTRIFHWSFAAVVLLAFATSEGGDTILSIHVFLGTVLVGFVTYRLIWGVIGSRYAQFVDFVYGPATVMDYAKRLIAFRLPYSVGHNPLGGWMVLALLGVVLVASLTGMMVVEDGYVGPLSNFAGGIFGHLHEGLGTFVMVLVGVHVAGVFAHLILSRENLIRSMLTGMKHAPNDEPAESIRPVGLMRPLIAVAIAVPVVLYFLR